MNIELKNIRHYPRMSEETEAYIADVFIDGQKAGVAKNEGHGGNTFIQAYNAKGNELIMQAVEYCKTLPPRTTTLGDEPFTYNVNLDEFVDELFYAYLEKKDKLAFERKREKATTDHLVIGINDKEYATIKLAKPVNELVQISHSQGEEYLKIMIRRHVVPNLKEGHVLINNNIPEKILREAGLKEGQFIPNQLKTLAEQLLDRPAKKTKKLKK